jgi:uncharacterized protein YjbI with pentapeptide repeats
VLEARFRSWWLQIKRPLSVIGIIALSMLAIVLIVGVIGGYIFNWGWASVRQKTLWDWLQLIFIPAVLTFGAIWYTARHNHDLHITLDNQRETLLQTYLDKMSELLLHENLRQSKRGDDVANIAHARTFTVLPQLNPNRKRSVILFLAESRLIDRGGWIIDMSFADLRGVDLSQATKLDSISLEGAYLQGANLSGANLSRVNFQGANLRHANLTRTDLTEATLNYADLSGSNLTEANLKGATDITIKELEKQAKSLKGATMPDGSIHP